MTAPRPVAESAATGCGLDDDGAAIEQGQIDDKPVPSGVAAAGALTGASSSSSEKASPGMRSESLRVRV